MDKEAVGENEAIKSGWFLRRHAAAKWRRSVV
jgi:hypothetical protein